MSRPPIDHLIHPSLRRDATQLARARLLAAFAMLSMALLGLSQLARAQVVGLHPILPLITLIVGGGMLTSLLLLYRLGALGAATLTACLPAAGAILLSSIWDGGVYAPGMLTLTLLPVVSTFAGGRRIGILVTTVTALGYAAVAVVGTTSPELFAPPPAKPMAFVTPMMLALGVALYLLCRYERIWLEVEQLKDDLLATTSHELRTPLTSIRGALGLLAGGAGGPLEHSARDLVEIGQRNTEQLLELVNDILDARTLSDGRAELRMAPLDLKVVLHSCHLRGEGLASERHITLSCVLPEAPVTIHGDRKRLQQVVDNLLSNAVKFSDPMGTVRLTLTTTDQHARITVEDTGRGIPEDFISQVFDRFSRADTTSSSDHSGTGLGLYITRLLVEAHGGTIEVDTVEGLGSTFIVSLPLAR